jgi:hypothetical protein
MSYIFKYKKGFIWKSIKAAGHRLHPELNRMDVHREDGTILSIGSWDKCDLQLGKDWILFTKTQMEAESGQNIKLQPNIKV